MTLETLKLLRSIDARLEQLSNMQERSFAELVLNVERLIAVNAEQFANIPEKVTPLAVSKLLRSMVSSRLHPSNICWKFVTLLVTKPEVFKFAILEQFPKVL